MSEKSVPQSKYFLVQVLRGIAVTLVLLFHLTNFFPNGYLGVDVFFMISGFVLARQFQTLGRKADSLLLKVHQVKEFSKARILRLFPAFSIVTSITMVLLFLTSSKKTLEISAKQAFASLIGIGNFSSYSLSGDYFHPEPNTLLHLWSLSAEVQIYSIMMVLVLMSSFINIQTWIPFTILGIVSVVFTFPLTQNAFYSQVGIQNPSTFSYYSPLTHIYQFVVGFLVYHSKSRLNIRLNTITSFIAFFSYFLIAYIPHFYAAAPLMMFITLVLLSGVRAAKSNFERILSWLGDRSYSIYLIHLPAYYVIFFILIQLHLERSIPTSTLTLIITLFLSHLSFKKVEIQIRTNWHQDVRLKQKLLLLLCMCMCTMTACYILSKSSNEVVAVHQGTNDSFSRNCTTYVAKEILRCGKKESLNRVLVVGDSHAGILAESAISALSYSDWRIDISVFPSCPFVNQGSYAEDSCKRHNFYLNRLINDNAYRYIIVTFRNPNFYSYTPGKSFISNYDQQALIRGIEFLSQKSSHVLFFSPNSEFIQVGPISHFLNPNWRVRSSDAFSGNLQFRMDKNVEILRMDDFLCKKGVCDFEQLSQFLGKDGNHLNSHAVKSLSKYFISSILQS